MKKNVLFLSIPQMVEKHMIYFQYKFLLNILFFMCVFVQSFGSGDPKTNRIRGKELNHQLIGAELYASVIQPGKMSITLQTFYNSSQTSVPEIETITLLENKGKTNGKPIELKKVNEFIDVKYNLVEGSQSSIPLSVKSIIYGITIDVGLSAKSYDVSWTYDVMNRILNNVAINNGATIVLVAHIADVTTSTYNNSPILGRLPVFKVSSSGKSVGHFDVTDSDHIDIVEVILGAPLLLDTTEKKDLQSEKTQNGPANLRKPDYRKGFSAEMPIAESFFYNKDTKEFVFDRPAFGSYLFALTISDYRNQILQSQHQAVFIIESIL